MLVLLRGLAVQVCLETERLLLRRFTEADADNMFDLDRDPEVMRFVGCTSTTRRAIEHDFLPAYFQTAAILN